MTTSLSFLPSESAAIYLPLTFCSFVLLLGVGELKGRRCGRERLEALSLLWRPCPNLKDLWAGLGSSALGSCACAGSTPLLLQQSRVCLGGSRSLSGAGCRAPWAGALLSLLLFLTDLTKGPKLPRPSLPPGTVYSPSRFWQVSSSLHRQACLNPWRLFLKSLVSFGAAPLEAARFLWEEPRD